MEITYNRIDWMKKILIAYGDDKMKFSLDFLGRQAKSLHVFDEVILYHPKDMPKQIQKSPLFNYSRGGGYWVWKPYILWHTLQQCTNDDIVCYIDAGCTLFPGKDWDKYFSYLKNYDTLCFQYKDNVAEFGDYGETSTQNKCWTKKRTLVFFDNYFNNINHREFNQTLSGIIFCKNTNNEMIKEWYQLTIKYPFLNIDPSNVEIEDQFPFFSGYHRHDQSVFTALAYKYSCIKNNALVLYENFEPFHSRKNQIIRAVRLRNINEKKIYRKFLIKFYSYRFFHIPFYWKGVII